MMPVQPIVMEGLLVAQPVGQFYIASMDAYQLLSICEFDFRRNDGVSFIGIQREVRPRRVKEIETYIKTEDATFPTSIVISVDEKNVEISDCVGSDRVKKIIIKEYIDPEHDELSIPFGKIATIIDGQHRLKAFENVSGLSFDVSVSIFIGIDQGTEATIFSTVNLAQTKVNRSLVYDLFSFAKSRSPERTCHEITIALDEMEESPFHKRIKRLGVATDGRLGETLSQATIVKGILPYITDDPLTDRNIGRTVGFWDPVTFGDSSKRIFRHAFVERRDAEILRNILNYFIAISQRWPDAWFSTERGCMIARTNGYNGFMRFLRLAYLSETTAHEVVSVSTFKAIFERVALTDSDFVVTRYVPGTSGASQLFRDLCDQTGLGT